MSIPFNLFNYFFFMVKKAFTFLFTRFNKLKGVNAALEYSLHSFQILTRCTCGA